MRWAIVRSERSSRTTIETHHRNVVIAGVHHAPGRNRLPIDPIDAS
jgi:hypothetical protein